MLDFMPNVNTESIPPADENLFDMLLLPGAEASDSVAWPDATPLFDLSAPLIDFPTAAQTSPLLQIPSERDSSAKKCTGGFCAEDCNCPTSNGSTRSTTACTEAYQMVLQYNRKGLDMVEINIRLWSGFRAGKEGDGGCTVDNKVLFDLLGYISV
jgi:hypothetical protein